MQPTQYAQGATIFAQGDPSAAVYVIEHGEVAISVGQGRDAVEVARLHAGDLFGESGVLEGRTRAATATALTPCTVLTTDAETFLHAFGLTNDRALVLLKLLCRRLRHTNRLAAGADMAPGMDTANALPRLRLMPLLHPAPGTPPPDPIAIEVLPFQVGNRFGGEVRPVGSNHCYAIAANGEADLAAPHFEVLRRDGRLGVRDLGTRYGTIVNGQVLTRASLDCFAALRPGNNEVIAGRPASPFRFRISVGRAA